MPKFIDLLNDVKSVVDDFNQTTFDFVPTVEVPCIDDTDLTFGDGEEKKGKHIKTCVLYVDIRNSVEMVHRHSIEKMGKVYSAFTKSVQMAAISHNGRIRNIIGDRVMVVFPKADCYKNAVDCAISINHLMKYVLNKKIYGMEFQCGIGIDCGDMYCIKVGMPKRGEEREDNRRLVWVGDPANHASRLTDFANKEYSELKYKVLNHFRTLRREANQYFNPSQLTGVQCREEIMTGDEAVNKILDGTSVHIQPINKIESYQYSPILISENVYNGFRLACPYYNSIKNNWWKETGQKIRDINFKVYGADLEWKLD